MLGALKGFFFSAAFSLGSFLCPIPLGEEVHEVAETSGFLTPSFIGAHPDPHCWTLQNSLIHIQTFSLAVIEIAGLCWSSNPSEVSLWGRGGPGGHLVREESRYAETSVTSSLRGKLLIKGFKRPRSRPDTEVVSV